MHSYFAPLEKTFRDHRNPEFAEKMKAYLKNHFEFFGIKQSPRRALFKEFMKAEGLPAWEDTKELIQELYIEPEREYDYCAIELMMKFKKQWKEEDLDFMEWMLANNSWWDSVDYISADIVGAFFLKFPTLIHDATLEWINSDNFWLKRTAIICQRKYKTKANLPLLFRNIESCIHEKEFFIAKGIGWALREHAKTFPDQILEFVHSRPLLPLSKREALKHFP